MKDNDINAQNTLFESARQFQQTLTEGWSKAIASMYPTDMGNAGIRLMERATKAQSISFDPEKLQILQQQYFADAGELWAQSLQGAVKLQTTDKRFTDPSWQASPLAAFTVATYLLNAKTLCGLVDAVDTDAKTRARIQFAVEQINAAVAPSNFMALNVHAQQKALATQGASVAQGITNLLHDIGQGHISMTDESVFEVGKNVATTEGAVVFENDLFQLIEYKALTDTVFERPFLIVPPCINKFYILDLQPENSLIRYAVSQGHRTFVLSWRNPDASLAHKTWDDYVEDAVIKAISVTQTICGAPTVNTLGFCVGGTLLGCALAVQAARGNKPAASATFLTSMLDFADTGVLDVFIDEDFVQYREQELSKGGLLKGQDLANTFSILRPNDLVWNYVAGNYLKGETPPPFDLLYWNSDSTNLPGPLYAWYLRATYLENQLTQPGKAIVCGQPIDLGRLDMPVYIYGSREDHIVPIGGAYASTQYLPGHKRFVMGASGHIAGVINPPAKNKRSHWLREDGIFPATHAQWVSGATEHPGSWWTDWSHWLALQAGDKKAAPKHYGKGKFKVIEAAPGRYVKVKS